MAIVNGLVLVTVVIGGIASNTRLTLLVLPALFSLVGRKRYPKPQPSDG